MQNFNTIKVGDTLTLKTIWDNDNHEDVTHVTARVCKKVYGEKLEAITEDQETVFELFFDGRIIRTDFCLSATQILA